MVGAMQDAKAFRAGSDPCQDTSGKGAPSPPSVSHGNCQREVMWVSDTGSCAHNMMMTAI